MLKFLFILLAMVLLAVSAAWVSFQSDMPALPDDPQNRGAFIFADTTEPTNLDPGVTSASIDFRILKCLYQPLLVYEFGGEGLELGAAESYTISDDGLVYTFQLREDGRWSDGERVTASDFVYAWRRAMLHDTGSAYASLFDLIKGAKAFRLTRQGLLDYSTVQDSVASAELEQQAADLSAQEKLDLTFARFDETVGLKAIGDYTLEITLESPTAYFIELCAFPSFSPVPEHVVAEYTELDEETGSFRTSPKYWGNPELLVTNGPYTLSDWQPKQRLILDQNTEYWAKDEMGNIRIIQHIIPDQTLALLRYRDRQIHWITAVNEPELKAKLLTSEYEYSHIVPRAGVYYYEFNCRPERIDGRPNPFADPRLRQALSMCINRQEIVEFVTRGNEPVARTFVPEGQIPGYEVPADVGHTYDPAQAKALLEEAGYPGGAGLDPITLLINTSGTSGSANENIANRIKKVWEDELGLVVNIEQPEFQIYLQESKQGNFDVRRAGWFGDYRDPTTWLDMLRTGDSNNDAKYHNPEFDSLLVQAAGESDVESRRELLAQAESMLLNDAAVCPIYNYAEMLIYDADWVDVGPNPWNNLRLDLVRVTRD